MNPTVSISLDLTPAVAERLTGVICQNFLSEQPDRFEHAELATNPFSPEFDAGALMWCETISDALLRLAYERACGYDALLLHDLAARAAGNAGRHVILTTRPWRRSSGPPRDSGLRTAW